MFNSLNRALTGYWDDTAEIVYFILSRLSLRWYILPISIAIAITLCSYSDFAFAPKRAWEVVLLPDDKKNWFFTAKDLRYS